MYWTRILLIVQITTVRSSIIDPFRSFLWAISLNNSFLSFGNLSAERFLNYLLANYAFLNFDLLSVRSLNFFKISAPFFIRPFFIIGDCVYKYYVIFYIQHSNFLYWFSNLFNLRIYSNLISQTVL